MQIINSLVNLFSIKPNMDIIEKIREFRLTAISETLSIPDKHALLECLAKYPPRDAITIDISLDGTEPISMYKPRWEQVSEEVCTDFLNELQVKHDIRDPDSCFKITVSITKEPDREGNISVYSLSHFAKFWSEQPMQGLLYSFSSLVPTADWQQKTVFNICDSEISFGTQTFYFKGTNSEEEVPDFQFKRIDLIEKRNEICNFLNAAQYPFVPEDFYLITRSGNQEIDSIFDRLCNLFSVIFLSSVSSFPSQENVLHCRLNGYKLIENELHFEDVCTEPLYYEIYRWTYGGGNLTDKIGLARNIITLHAKDDSLLNVDESTLASIKSSYEIYLKENVQQYLEIKNKVTEVLIGMSQNSSQVVKVFADSLKNNSMAFLMFFLSVIVFNSLALGRMDNIFTRDITYISYGLLLLSFLHLLVSIYEIHQETQRAERLHQRLKESYSNILDQTDLENIFDKDQYLKDDLKYITSKTITYALLWLLTLIIIYVIVSVVRR